MKKLLILFFGGLFLFVNAQSYRELNKLLYRLEQENKINHDSEMHYDLDGKKFLYVKDYENETERWVLEIKNDEAQLIELIDDKGTGKTISQIYTGDVIRKKHVVSLRFDQLEGQRLGTPLTFLHHITYQGGVWYLIDVNAGNRWIDIDDLGKKKEETMSKRERKYLEKIKKRRNKNRD